MQDHVVCRIRFYINYSDTTSCGLCGKNCCNYKAAIVAIKTATQLLYQQFNLVEQKPCEIVVSTDALSVLKTPKKTRIEIKDIYLAATPNLIASYLILKYDKTTQYLMNAHSWLSVCE